MSVNNSLQIVRTSYTALMGCAASACVVAPAQRDILKPMLTKAVEKAHAQPLQVF